MNTTPENLEITATTPAGNAYRVAVYVDPFPGRKGTDRVVEVCGRCNGAKVIHWGNVTLTVNGVSGRVCFQCNGLGTTSTLVSSRRQTAKRQAKAETLRNAEAADFAAEAGTRQAAELEADHAEALRINAARDAKAKGFLGQEGERLRNLNARVVLVRSYEKANYVTGAPELGYVVKFDVLGRTAVWFTSNPHGLKDGDFVTLAGTVKDHSNRDGEDQTVLTRCLVK